MYNEVLKVLNNHNEMRLKDIVSEVSDLLNLSIEDRNLMLDNNKSTIIYYRLGWTKTYLVKAGLLETIKEEFSKSLLKVSQFYNLE
ncbi:winged helix-turn-helix domain-containing protein [Coprobacillaceae bacterium CR2/5/TPMF4]|nr:winged helix-turn-helix domain-containing protein [Coprobacillaceae bacterium CR2/5/TPMF4]